MPYELIWYQPISPSWMSSTRDLFGVDQVEVRAWHQVGKELKIETNVGEMKLTVRRTPDYFVEFIRMGETMLKSKTFIITTTGNKRSVVLNGKELTVVDFQRGARRISQTTELPSGEHLTTTVEWAEDSLKKNQ